MLLFDIFLHFAQAFLIDNLGGVPGFAKQGACSLLICIPKNVGDPRQSARAQFQIAVTSGVGGQRDQQRLSIGAPLAQDSRRFGVPGCFIGRGLFG